MTGTESEAESETETETETESVTVTEPEPEAESEAENETEAESETESGAESTPATTRPETKRFPCFSGVSGQKAPASLGVRPFDSENPGIHWFDDPVDSSSGGIPGVP